MRVGQIQSVSFNAIKKVCQINLTKNLSLDGLVACVVRELNRVDSVDVEV